MSSINDEDTLSQVVSAPKQKTFTILVVDDQPKTLIAVEAALSPLNVRLLMASSGEEALRLLLNETADLILLDVRMSGMDGLETAELIRNRKQFAHVPLIFMSAIDKEDAHVFKGYQKGAVDYIFKPFNPKVLRSKIAVFIEVFQTSEKLRESEEQLSQINAQLQQSNELLAKTVEERTAELQRTNKYLRAEIEVRRQVEETVRLLNAELMSNMARLEQANKELDAFSYTISHDLKAPLKRIEGFMSVILLDHAKELSETGREYFNRVMASAEHMSQMITALLDLSRLNSADMVEATVDLSALAKQAALDLQARHPEREVEFVIADGLVAKCDQHLLGIAIENLFSNAFKFTANRPIPRIEFGSTAGEGRDVYYVRDNGVGFDSQYLHKLFQPFSRLHLESEYPGTGIGLATVHRIIGRHGGQIWAEGEIDSGATFYFTLQ